MELLLALFTADCIDSLGPIVIESSFSSINSDCWVFWTSLICESSDEIVLFSSAETAGIMITKSKNIRRTYCFLIFSPPVLYLN